MKKCGKKNCRVIKYIPHALFAIALVIFGAIGKLTGTAPSVEMFETINVFGLGETFGRIMVGLGQVFAGIGVFFISTRKVAAIMGIAIMTAAITLQLTILGGSVLMAVIVMALGIYILLKSCRKCCKKTCENDTCSEETYNSEKSEE